MEVCWQDANLALMEEDVSMWHCSPAVARSKRNDWNTYYLRLNRVHRFNKVFGERKNNQDGFEFQISGFAHIACQNSVLPIRFISLAADIW